MSKNVIITSNITMLMYKNLPSLQGTTSTGRVRTKIFLSAIDLYSSYWKAAIGAQKNGRICKFYCHWMQFILPFAVVFPILMQLFCKLMTHFLQLRSATHRSMNAIYPPFLQFPILMQLFLQLYDNFPAISICKSRVNGLTSLERFFFWKVMNSWGQTEAWKFPKIF